MSTVTASRPRTPSLGPAVIVVGLAVLILIAGAAVAVIGTSSAHPSVSQLGTNVPGVPFKAIPAASDLGHIEAGKEPPPDIVEALTVPAISRYVGYSDEDGDAGQFDRSVTFSVPATPALVAHFYSKELPGSSWSLQFDGFRQRGPRAHRSAERQRRLPMARRRRDHHGEPDVQPVIGGFGPDVDELGRADALPGRGRQLALPGGGAVLAPHGKLPSSSTSCTARPARYPVRTLWVHGSNLSRTQTPRNPPPPLPTRDTAGPPSRPGARSASRRLSGSAGSAVGWLSGSVGACSAGTA